MISEFKFSFANLNKYFKEVREQNYTVLTCKEFASGNHNVYPPKVFVNRVDIDVSPKKARIIAEMFNNLGIKATFFIRMHANEYNFFSFENYRIFCFIRDSGHEIGYHSEIIDQAAIWDEPAEQCLLKDLEILSKTMNITIYGVASHGGMTGLNNLDFWENKKPGDFGLLYETYDKQPEFNLFYRSFFISDSNWTYWKCYNKGVLVDGDKRSLGDHVKDGHPLIYSLIHPETYFENHIYE